MRQRHKQMLREIDELVAAAIGDGRSDAQLKQIVQAYLGQEIGFNDLWTIANDAVLSDSKRRVNKKKPAKFADGQRELSFPEEEK